MIVIRCTVSGGLTGYRESLLKTDGKVQEFQTMEEANAMALNLTSTMNRFSTQGAHYTYAPEHLEG